MKVPFKMRSSPTKGKLRNFFNSVGANLKRNRPISIGDEAKAKYKGSKQTTNKAGEKVGYKETFDLITRSQGGRSRQVAKGNTDTRKQGDEKFKKRLSDKADAAHYGSAADKAQ